MPIYMVFMDQGGATTYVASYTSYGDADAAVRQMNLTKGPDTAFIVINGYRYE